MTSDARGRVVGGTGEIAARLHTVAIRLLRRLRPVDEASGLSAARLSALSVLVYGGARAMGELASAEQVSAPTMTRLVSGLESDGYVRRERDERDGRSVVVTPTARGRRVLEAGRRRRVEALSELLSELTPRESVQLSDAVATLERLLGPRSGMRHVGTDAASALH